MPGGLVDVLAWITSLADPTVGSALSELLDLPLPLAVQPVAIAPVLVLQRLRRLGVVADLAQGRLVQDLALGEPGLVGAAHLGDGLLLLLADGGCGDAGLGVFFP